MKKILEFILPAFITLLLGIFIGFVSSSASQQYYEIIKPSYSPNAIIFPIVWSFLYIIMGIAFSLAYQESKKESILFIYVIQLFFNLTWPLIFFIFKYYLLSALWIILLILSIIAMMYIFYQENKLSAYLLIPYLLWCFFALILSFQIFLLNK